MKRTIYFLNIFKNAYAYVDNKIHERSKYFKPEHQLLTIESNINEWFNRLKKFIKTNPLNKSTKRKSNFLKIKS